MFSRFLKSFGLRKRNSVLLSPLAGKVIPLSEVNDQTFAAGLLGQGVAIEPTGNKVVAPSDSRSRRSSPPGTRSRSIPRRASTS